MPSRLNVRSRPGRPSRSGRRGASGDVPLALVFEDLFTEDSNTQLTAHTPDVTPGGSWADNIGSFVVNAAADVAQLDAKATLAGSDQAICTFPFDEADGELEATWSAFSTEVATTTGLIVRYVDNNNWIRWVMARSGGGVYGLYLQRLVAGANTNLLIDNGYSAWSPGDTLKVALNGSSIKCYYNDELKADVTDTNHQSATRHGVTTSGYSGVLNSILDDYQITSMTFRA